RGYERYDHTSCGLCTMIRLATGPPGPAAPMLSPTVENAADAVPVPCHGHGLPPHVAGFCTFRPPYTTAPARSGLSRKPPSSTATPMRLPSRLANESVRHAATTPMSIAPPDCM